MTSTVFVGPQTIPVGSNLGICQSQSGGGITTLTGCVPGGTPFSIVGGGIDIDTLTFSLVTVNRTATTTNTFLTTQLYEIDGFAQGVPVTPAPPTLLLALVGLMCAGLCAAWRKFSF